MSSFFDRKLDTWECPADGVGIKRPTTTQKPVRHTAGLIRQRIGEGGERLWRYEDFKGLPFTAVGQALSRLTRQGSLKRLSKGVYYHPRETAFGQSQANPAALQRLAGRRKAIFPAGIAAANLLRVTTQAGRRGEDSTTASKGGHGRF
jgi:hypothetical protein